MTTKEFDFLVDVIDEELMAQFWTRRFGSIGAPDATLARQAATSIAEEVQSKYRMDRRETAAFGGLKATGMTRKGFERLCDVVDQALAAEFTVRRFGQIDAPDPEGRRVASALIADAVLLSHRMEPRDRPT